MPQYQIGELVHTFSTTLRRRAASTGEEKEKFNLIQPIVVDCEDLEKGKKYIIEVNYPNKKDRGAVEFEARIHKSRRSFNIPKQFAKENNIYAGDFVTFNIFAREEAGGQKSIDLDEMKDKNRSRFLDTFTAYSAKDSPDGLGARGNSVRVAEYLGEETKPILIVNKRNEKEAVYRTSANLNQRRFSLPISIRESLDLEAGDTCEVYKVNGEDKEQQEEVDNTEDGEAKERIEEIYQMVSELYEAYEQNN